MEFPPIFTTREEVPNVVHWEMCNQGFSFPQPIYDTNVNRDFNTGFVYCREYGFFPCSSASHQLCMSTLLAWEMGLEDYMSIDEESFEAYTGYPYGTGSVARLSDIWLEMKPGRAYQSSIGSGKIYCARKGYLNHVEIDIMGMVEYFDKRNMIKVDMENNL